MNDQALPRVTRARAAAKTENPGVNTTKIATASSKAKSVRSEPPTKRRTRADDEEHQEEEEHQTEEIIELQPKSTRGRPKKAIPTETMQEAVPAVKATRGRPKKVIAETSVPVAGPVRSTRGRQKKIEVEGEAVVVEEPVKHPTRARAVPVLKAAVPKKSVKFEEPDKENIMPTGAKDNKIKVADTATGLRAKPVRKPAATRTTRGNAKSGTEERVPILSPKKATQIATAKDSASEDELATTEKTPMRPLQKSPVKPVGNTFGSARKPDLSTSITVNRASVPTLQDFKNSTLASPARHPPPSPFKESLKDAPQRGPLAGSILPSPFKLSLGASKASTSSPFKASLLASPARRPQSPTKVLETGSPSRSTSNAPLFAVTPKASTFKVSRFTTPRTLTKSVGHAAMMLPPVLPSAIDGSPASMETLDLKIPDTTASFSGRLYSIVPREVDIVCELPEATHERDTEVQQNLDIAQDEPEISAEQPDTIVMDEMDVESTTLSASPLQETAEVFVPVSFEFREADENPFADSDSEDELADMRDCSPVPLTGFRSLSRGSSPAIPGPKAAFAKTPKNAAQKLGQNHVGFTPLAKQLSDWMAVSPVKMHEQASPSFEDQLQADSAPAISSPIKSTFFDDEIPFREELAEAPEPVSMEIDLLDIFDTVELEEEDLALAHEADEMSLMELEEVEALMIEEFQAEEDLQIEEVLRDAVKFQQQKQLQAENDTELEDADAEEILQDQELEPSETSQEYADENAVPINPTLPALPLPKSPAANVNHNFVTPKRVLSERTFHTVSKVPLKPAAEHTPMRVSPKKRSASISRLPVQRPTSTLPRNNTVIPYSPTKSKPRARSAHHLDVPIQNAVATPSRGGTADWASPARTPHREINTTLLKGSVVFVDVHTTEGADASVLFTELLTQMGARCVKTWNWNGEDGSKIGITHVVFKDGGKRTLERVREANGVVACVGVGWVLDCEREDAWLDEAPYGVDTALVPRGGHKRRKSMEPRALANLNGTLVPSSSATPGRKSYANMSPTKEFSSFPDTPVTNKSRRRESVQWQHSPSSTSASPEDKDGQTLLLMLEPVPATPAQEMISAYGEDGIYGETPGPVRLMQQTAPVSKFVDGGEKETGGIGGEKKGGMGGVSGLLGERRDESVMMRLMAARRKSLQWAPKVGSPLARGSLF